MIEALIAGETNPTKLAGLASTRIKASPTMLSEALRGRVTKHHRFLLRLHLEQIDTLDRAIAQIDSEVEAGLDPFRPLILVLTSIPGIGELAARVLLAEIGADMSRFPTAGHLISWAGLCPKNDESAGKRRSNRIEPPRVLRRLQLLRDWSHAPHGRLPPARKAELSAGSVLPSARTARGE
jgi:transposase